MNKSPRRTCRSYPKRVGYVSSITQKPAIPRTFSLYDPFIVFKCRKSVPTENIVFHLRQVPEEFTDREYCILIGGLGVTHITCIIAKEIPDSCTQVHITCIYAKQSPDSWSLFDSYICQCRLLFFPVIGEIFVHNRVEILVFTSPTGYILTSSGLPLLNWGIFYKFPLKWTVIFLQSWTSTGYFSNSKGLFVTNCMVLTNHRFFLFSMTHLGNTKNRIIEVPSSS